ncbi:hypothetical protein HY768_05970 [candidate division TA06 bacterium]|uniref:Uncharacterized protein n=1 Tax=candidate division TA06 bacterium TaxID=2250710 RepID=A0A933MJK2_UNCT6|nr:hypothetical protein [candidate division TA06 bacterium]
MKKILLSGLLLAVLARGLCAQNIDSALNFYIKMSTPDLNLYFLDHGFLDVVQAHGTVGMMVNPAGLERTQGLDIFVAGSLSKDVSGDFKIKVIDSSEVSPSISVPTTVTLTDLGGLDYVGVAGKAGPVGIGIAVQRGSGMEMGLDSGIVQISKSLSYEYPYLLDSTVTGFNDTVTVNWKLSGTGVITMGGQGNLSLMNTPVFLGSGTKFGPFKVGMGLKVTKMAATGDFSINTSGRVTNLSGIVDDSLSRIRFDSVSVRSSFDSSIFYDRFTCTLSGTQVSMVLSANFEIPILKAGMSIEKGMPYTLTGDYYNNAGIPFGQPRLDSVSVGSLAYDTLTQTFTGDANLYLGGIEYKHKSADQQTGIDFPGMLSIKASLGLKFWGFRLGINGGTDIMNGQWPMLGNAYTSAGTSLSIKKATLCLGLAGRWQYVALDQKKIYSTPPMVLAGAGLRMPVYVGEVMLATRMNLANGLLKVQNLSGGGDFKPWETLALSAGVRVDLGFLSRSDKKSQTAGTETAKPVEEVKPGARLGQVTIEGAALTATGDTLQIKAAVNIYQGPNASWQDALVYADFLRTEMANTGRFSITPKDRMQELLARKNMGQTYCLEPICAAQMGQALNVRQMLVGQIDKTETGYYVKVFLVDAATGQQLRVDQDQGADLTAVCASTGELAKRLLLQ